MAAISIDSEGHARRGGISPKGMGIALIVLLALAVAALGAYWLTTAPAGPAAGSTARPEASSRPAAPAASEPLLKAPAASCVDGRPASDEVPADACL
jgi:hypothetical protein